MKDKNALITGASTGIGEACALYLAERGWRVFAGVRKPADAKRLEAAAEGIRAVTVDVTKPVQIAAAVKVVQKQVGRAGLQGLVNNAGVVVGGPLEFLPLDELRFQHEVNFLGQIAVTQAFLPLLRQGQGRVVNMSSISGRVTTPFLGPYSTSKFALEAFSDGLRRELRPWGLHVASILPGPIATPLWDKSLDMAETMSAKLPKQAEALYGKAMRRRVNTTARLGMHGVPPEAVARDVLHALSAARPRIRYAPGRFIALAIWALRFAPDRLLDWVLTRDI
ncbi:MAG: SDR family oxidoreductase [Anaerolineales bacterium]|nr:SDR family oxidoreductase [Anaerolineales bacterium]